MNDHVLSRQSVLVWSILGSLLLHGSLVFLAPSITVLTAKSQAPVVSRLRMKLIELPAPVARPTPVKTGIAGLASRPENIADLLKNSFESVEANGHSDVFTEVPRLVERTTAKDHVREFDVSPTPELHAELDAKIIEIEADVARSEVKVVRRVVTPSSTRIIAEGEYPVIRGDQVDSSSEVLNIDPLTGLTSETLPEIREETGTGEGETTELVQEILAAAVPSRLEESALEVANMKETIASESGHEVIDEHVKVELATYVERTTNAGFFRVRIAAAAGKALEVLPKDVTFIVDASSSIAQPKLDVTIKGVLTSLKSLNKQDRFNVVLFRDQPELFGTEPVSVTEENLRLARKFLSGAKSGGETNVYEAIRPVLRTNPRPGVASIVLLMSDGKPTSGEKDAQTIINVLTDENARRNTIFAFGGGRSVNRYLLDLLAYLNRGESTVAPKYESIDQDFPKFFGNLGEPVLVQCDASIMNVDSNEVFPKAVEDFYNGRAVTLYGLYNPSKEKDIVLRLAGLAGSNKKEVIFKGRFADAVQGKEDIARNWAFSKAYFLIGEMCRTGETPERLEELRQLSDRYKISTIYTKQ